MKGLRSALPFAFLAATPILFAFDKPKAYLPGPVPKIAPVNADVYDLLILERARPFWLRLHVRAGRGAFSDQWTRALDALFADLDRNGDGRLDAAECRRIPHRVILIQATIGAFPYYALWQPPPFEELDENSDGFVSLAELEHYYARSAIRHANTTADLPPDRNARAITDKLFNLLDRNKNGKITRDEAKTAEAWLDHFDANDDECLTVDELIPNLSEIAGRYSRGDNPIVLLVFARIGHPPPGFVSEMLDRYDRDHDSHLSRFEIGLDEPAFAALDRDGDGLMNTAELADFFARGLPDVELELSLDADRTIASATRIVAQRRAGSARFAGPGQIAIETDTTTYRIGESPNAVYAAQPEPARSALTTRVMNEFRQAANGKTFLDAADFQSAPGRNLEPFLGPANRNGDGRLNLQELEDHLNLLSRFGNATLTLSCNVSAPNWFALLDTNKDGRLSRKELQDAWQSLTDGRPTVTELTRPDGPASIVLELHRSRLVPKYAPEIYLKPVPFPAPTRGPLWFRKMDRNGDGYVSRREFLGTKAEFDRIDRNGDGLIDPDEAEASEKK